MQHKRCGTRAKTNAGGSLSTAPQDEGCAAVVEMTNLFADDGKAKQRQKQILRFVKNDKNVAEDAGVVAVWRIRLWRSHSIAVKLRMSGAQSVDLCGTVAKMID
jgi:hypothetical protein